MNTHMIRAALIHAVRQAEMINAFRYLGERA
jgi:hypothetical protein